MVLANMPDLEKVEVNGKMQEMIRLIYADNDLLYVNINSLKPHCKYSGKEGARAQNEQTGYRYLGKAEKNHKKKS